MALTSVPHANHAMDSAPRSRGPWLRAGLALLILVGLATRLEAPSRMEVINDEMLHLQSWRNRYGTRNQFPVFVARLESLPRSSMNQRLIRLYQSGPLAQRGFLILVDGHPILFPGLMELIEALTHSSLIAQRLVSTAASIGTLVAAFLVGRRIRDDTLGLCIAALFCVSAVSQYFAGIARPYATSELVVMLAVLAFVDDSTRKPASPRRMLCFALLAQFLQWFNWVPVGVLVAAVLIRRRQSGTSIATLARQSAWYVVVSLLLVVYLFVQTKNPTLAGRLGPRPLADMWIDFTAASPLSQLGRLGATGFAAGAAIFLLLAGAGCAGLFGRGYPAAIRWPFLISTAACGVMMIISPSGTRFLIPFMVLPVVMAGIGLAAVGRTPKGAAMAALALLLPLGALSLAAPVDPYTRHVREDEPYARFAAALTSNLKPGDAWIAYPYFFADRLYRYGALPAPLQPQSENQMNEALAHRQPGVTYFVLTLNQGDQVFPVLRMAQTVLKTPGGMALLRLPARSDPE